MKNRRKRDVVSWSRFFWCTLFTVFSCVLLSASLFVSTFRIFFGETFRPVLASTWRTPAVEAVAAEYLVSSAAIPVYETIMFPDQILIFLKYPSPARLFTKEDLHCVYSSSNCSSSQLKQPPSRVDMKDLEVQIVRCPVAPRGFTVSLATKPNSHIADVGPAHKWDLLVYEALIDCDGTTIVFVKGLNIRPEKLSNASRYECVYGWDFTKPKLLLRSEGVSVAQEIVRCKTPMSLLNGQQRVNNNSIKVSVRVKGNGDSGTLPSIARPRMIGRACPHPDSARKEHEICVCTMLRNGARFLKEWVMYHGRIGVQRWFIYDNNSEDEINDVIDELSKSNHRITRHVWPWVKTQEAGFAHCAIRARELCEWVGFIDVDEYFHLPTPDLPTIQDVIRNQTATTSFNVGELRGSCHSFGPSDLTRIPPEGVTVGYTCRLQRPERHKSIVKPEAMNTSLINIVHHFHLSEGYVSLNVDKELMVVNHYKYQVWEVFREKFYRRVATYVVDWQNEENESSKDRVPGLGTRAVEPPDWAGRFCEVRDTGLRDRVMEMFSDAKTHRLPWEEEEEQAKIS